MIAGISIRNFKIVQGISDPLPIGRFHVLVGPNASGKSTFLESFDFVRDCLRIGPRKAVEKRVPEYRDLTFMRRGGPIEFEFWLDMGAILPAQAESLINYRLVINEHADLGVAVVEEELKQYSKSWLPKGSAFGFSPRATPRRLLGKTSGGKDFYKRENGTYTDSFTFGLDKLTLSLTPQDQEKYPTGNAVRQYFADGIRYVQLNSRAMRDPCPATSPTELQLDGTNLPKVIGRLRGQNGLGPSPGPLFEWSEFIADWAGHLRYALEGLVDIDCARRLPDNAEYLLLRFDNGLECPSWLLSDGTLRMLALTLLAFLPPSPGIYMVEEPENGVHPKALEIILRSLSSVPRSQMLVATHSAQVVQQVGVRPLLCFSKDEQGAHILCGADHPILKEWDGSPDLATIFASGLLE